jgi:hypothetical protein
MPDCHKKGAVLVVIGCLFHELDLSIEDEIVSKEGDVIFSLSHSLNEVFVVILSGQKDCRRPAFKELVECIIMIFVVVRNRICPELVVDMVVCVAGSPPNADWRRLCPILVVYYAGVPISFVDSTHGKRTWPRGAPSMMQTRRGALFVDLLLRSGTTYMVLGSSLEQLL